MVVSILASSVEALVWFPTRCFHDPHELALRIFPGEQRLRTDGYRGFWSPVINARYLAEDWQVNGRGCVRYSSTAGLLMGEL